MARRRTRRTMAAVVEALSLRLRPHARPATSKSAANRQRPVMMSSAPHRLYRILWRAAPLIYKTSAQLLLRHIHGWSAVSATTLHNAITQGEREDM